MSFSDTDGKTKGGVVLLYEDNIHLSVRNLKDIAIYIATSGVDVIKRLYIPVTVCTILFLCEVGYYHAFHTVRTSFLVGDSLVFQLQLLGFYINIVNILLHATGSIQSDYKLQFESHILKYFVLLVFLLLSATVQLVYYITIAITEIAFDVSSAVDTYSDADATTNAIAYNLMNNLYISAFSIVGTALLLASIRIRNVTVDALNFVRKGVRPYERLIKLSNKKKTRSAIRSDEGTVYEANDSSSSIAVSKSSRSSLGNARRISYGSGNIEAVGSHPIRVRKSSVGTTGHGYVIGAKVLAQRNFAFDASPTSSLLSSQSSSKNTAAIIIDHEAFWFPGKISGIHRNGTYDIVYDYGDIEFHKPRSIIELLSAIDDSKVISDASTGGGINTTEFTGLLTMWKVGLLLHLVISMLSCVCWVLLLFLSDYDYKYITFYAPIATATIDMVIVILSCYMYCSIIRIAVMFYSMRNIQLLESKLLETCLCTIESIGSDSISNYTVDSLKQHRGNSGDDDVIYV